MTTYTIKYSPAISHDTKQTIRDHLNAHLSGNETSVYDLGDVVLLAVDEVAQYNEDDLQYLQMLLDSQGVDYIEI